MKRNAFFEKIYHLFLLYVRHRRKITYNLFELNLWNAEKYFLIIMKQWDINKLWRENTEWKTKNHKNNWFEDDEYALKLKFAISFPLIETFDKT